MRSEGEPREELLGMVRSLTERLNADRELERPLSYLSHSRHAVGADAGEEAAQEGARELSGLEAVRAELGDCRRCSLHRTRHSLVFGEGSPQAELVFVGEAPGADEDAQGRPFVGRAGQLLTKIIEAMGLKREEVYICNILKCRPPGNRNPLPDEIAVCEPFLVRQIEAMRPRAICAL
jgi:uracil-DNA glycosylase